VNLPLPHIKQKIAIIGTAGVPANYGGFETLAHYLVQYIGDIFDLNVYCSSKNYTEEERKSDWLNANLIYLPFNANGIQSIIYDVVSILHAITYANCLLILGVSGAIILPFIKLFSSAKIVVNIDGIEWKRNKWGRLAKAYLKFAEKLCVKFADEVIADNEVIARYVEDTYNVSANVIAYGGDHINDVEEDKAFFSKQVFNKKKYAFTVCRIEPENNIEMILKSFSKFKKLNYVIVGNWNSSDYGKRLKKSYETYGNIFCIDPIYDLSKLNALRNNAFIYIHGHSAGGTNPSLVEAMHADLPVCCFDVNFNRATTKNKALYFSNESNLIELIDNIENYDLKKVRSEMLSIAIEEYQWQNITKKYARLSSTQGILSNNISKKLEYGINNY